MNDSTVSATAVVAGALWVVSLAVWATAWTGGVEQLGWLAIIVAMMATTVSVRYLMVQMYKRIRVALQVTVEVERAGGVRTLH